MDFNVIITVPTSTTAGNGVIWRGSSHLPTIQISASCEAHARSIVHDIVAHMPEGTTFYMVAT